ncbi:uncharacterized protein LTR77_011215 [Saxophila tyrrhenica]|uniref:Uncharacterized protein n=1 Tax=Saxophila tyrrhenica TaxID=1690608 RepID=A0AAV9NT70_9PEZI|nr:hypothetical protein LTR77_011215 [Saxophila tyrrhenica]
MCLPGPRSYLSICSKPGVRWVNGKTQSVDFSQTAAEFSSYITGRLKMDTDLSSARVPDPDPQTAWRYTRAYFDQALDASLGIVQRTWFEKHLTAHQAGLVSDTSATWLALRSVVFAAGCRIELSKSQTFRKASKQAWRYFETALAVYARLIFLKTSIMGVQALTLMAVQIIDDDEITCALPQHVNNGSASNLAYCHSLIRLSQLLSRSEKRLSTARYLRSGGKLLMEAIAELQGELDSVRDTLNQSFDLQLGQCLQPASLPPLVSLDQLLYLHYAYLNATLSIHTVLSYPWLRALTGLHSQETSEMQTNQSAESVARAARAAILLTEHINLRAHTTLPVAYFGPVYAMTSLFVYCLDEGADVCSLALLDVATGYFARLQLATGAVVPARVARELSSLAHRYHQAPQDTSLNSTSSPNDPELAGGGLGAEYYDQLWDPGDIGNPLPLDFEDWSALLPVSSEEDPINLELWQS